MQFNIFIISIPTVIPASSFAQTTPSKTPLSRVPVSETVYHSIEIFVYFSCSQTINVYLLL